MPPRRYPTVRQKRLGAELRRLREAAGLSGEQAAEILECSKGKISRIETGMSGIRAAELKALLQAYDVDDSELVEALTEMAREGRRRNWWNQYESVLPPGFADLAELEAKALSLHSWETVLVPGLLQTPDYMRVLFRRGRIEPPEDEVEAHVRGRMHRQHVMHGGDATPDLWFVLYEAVLHARFGGLGVMREQLLHLTRMAQHDHVTLQVLPYTTDSHRGVNGPFGIVGMPDTGMDVVRAETALSSLYVQDHAQVAAYKLMFDQLRAVALGPGPSLKLIRDVAEGLRV
ncbi:helix-turn-helix domain-containing protein [Streptomyces poonensis]|uniref:Transcriptional regulator n=1 Tax=Streptomyces poonensis TaxID=68255 RepID=A0A918PNA5_9ACTN|nr:helix-turn-helix transcriptional regulator [Streptomyces poonensis]GGZ16984.1 transcriptional regulator [Streptomyces poonensis]GLJ92474.1 transcriptional regulator [Streptomyces poonensis]